MSKGCITKLRYTKKIRGITSTESLHKEFIAALDKAKVPQTAFYFSLMCAVANGDIIVENPKGNTKSRASIYVEIEEDPDKIRVFLKDKEGNLLNPTKIEEKYFE
jgi:hypothetical protein